MGEKIIVGPIDRGLKTNRTAFNIDNDSFPMLLNAFQWRGRVKRKRGTAFLARLTRYINSSISSYSVPTTISLSGGAGNLLTGFGLEANGNIVPGSVSISGIYTDPFMNGTLSGGSGGTINYSTGAITIVGGGSSAISAIFRYYPDLPTMGLEDLVLNSNDYPTNLSFDTTYSYVITPTDPAQVYDVSFYKNPPSGTYNASYVEKTSITPLWWNGEDYQQFWTVNYQGALWATNGVRTPFSVNNIGMPFKSINSVTVLTTTTATLTIPNHGLSVGDFVFVNEVVGTTGINFQTGFVISIIPNVSVVVKFPNATLVGNGTGGMCQYLTNRPDTTKDCIRWYDGDPTNGSPTSPVLNGHKGWVNFCPPLSEFIYSIADLPAAQYYLVGAKMIVPFKDRLLFLGPVVQTSSSIIPIYLKDTVIYSQNGTPYYTASFSGDVVSASTVFRPILVPDNQTATANAYFEDQTGFGGFISAGIDQEITTSESNEDVLIVGFTRLQSRLVYTGNDVLPFNFFTINSEYGSSSTFSSINMDKGVISRGSRGYIITSQVACERIDPEIPDQTFEIKLTQNGAQRICAQRDFINEWIFFTYPSNQQDYKFPNQTLFYNYRDNSWAIFNEAYTTYGLFRVQTGFTWATLPYNSWSAWNDPWDSGESTLLNPDNIAGNQQGFIVKRDEGTDESISLTIQSFSVNTVTSPDHCLNDGDYIIIDSCIGTISSIVNGKIFSISQATQNTFDLSPNIDATGLTYLGLGTITRMYVPQIQTKQFPTYWAMARKTRLGPQQYLFTTTAKSQITLFIFLSQNADSPYNDNTEENDGLIYTTVLYTCPESTNLGLTAANINLNLVTSRAQAQTWHRMNTSLIGDTVQIGFTLSDDQMRAQEESGQPTNAFSEIELHGFILDVTPSQLLC